MKIKAKVTFGVLFLFAVMLTVGGLGLYYLNELSDEADNILTDNYESLEYTKAVIQNCDSIATDSSAALASIEKNIRLQEDNVTEVDEGELTHQLRTAFEKIKTNGPDAKTIAELRQVAIGIQDVNMKAIVRKNQLTEETSGNASTYLVIIITICSIIAFTFIINFPGYIANPIVQLTESIKSIAGKDYEERLHFDRKDEFEELAQAFNQMAEKLDEYEHSNLAKILFEKKRIETIIDRMSDPVIGLDELNRIIFVNDRATDILNLERSEILDKYAPDVAVNNDLLRSLIRHWENGKESPLVKAVVKGKENYYSREAIKVSYTPTGERSNVQIGTVILLKNVTAYKELDLAKTNFIATISHELKTPLASLQMCVKLLQDTRVGDLNTEQKNVTQTLSDEIGRLSRLTNELLDLSQVETGNIKLEMKRSDPKDIITVAAEAVKFQAERKHVMIKYKTETDGLLIQADSDKTTWVLINLLTNAIRYSPENGTIIVSCRAVDGHIQFAVSDNGPGIESKYIDRIFEKFFQVPGTPSGTGLGLAISKEFIEAQGGSIRATSTPGQGSIFSFNLKQS